MPNVNNSPEHRKPVEQILRERGIALRDMSIRRQYTVCPKCSADRKKKKAECLAVTIEEDRVYWACNHCEDKGCEYFEQNHRPKPNGAKVYYNYTPTLRKVRLGKTHKPPFVWEHRDGTEWKPGTGGAKTADLLYTIDGCKAAIVAGKDIAAVEGEQDADTLWALGIPATCNAHGAGKWSKAHSEQLKGAKLVVLNDNDAPGIAHAEKTFALTKPVAASIVRADMKEIWPDCPEGGDVTDYIRSGHDFLADWKRLTATAPDQERPRPTGNGHTSLSDDEVAAMAAMSPIELEQTIKQLAEDKGVSRGAVKSEFKARATANGHEDDHKPGRKLEFEEPEPWNEEVRGDLLLDEIADEARRYLVLPQHGDTIIALWSVYSYMPRIYGIAPRIQITAPEKRCGKTTLLNFFHELVYRKLQCGNVTPAAFFRVVEAHHPCMLIDEVDTFAEQHPEIRNVLCHGHEVNGAVLRCAGDSANMEARYFSCFAPVAYAHIGALNKSWGQLLDRSIVIHMARRAPGEFIERLSKVQRGNLFKDLRRKLKRFALDNEQAIAAANPDMANINDRLVDNWRPLLAIAKVAGNGWLDRAMAAVADPDDEGSYGEMLLQDLYTTFQNARAEFLLTASILASLNAMEDRPWSEWGSPPKLLSGKALAKLLKEFGIKSHFDTAHTGKGYSKSDFEAAWKRYLLRESASPGSMVRNGGQAVDVSTNFTPKWQSSKASESSESSEINPDDWSFNDANQ